MYSILLLASVAFVLALVLTPRVRDLFHRLGILDHPDDERKVHDCPIPRAGGLVIAVAYLGAFGVLLLSNLSAGQIVWSGLPFVWKLFPAAGFIFLVGFLDDTRGLKAWQKLGGQIAAAGMACAAGVQIHSVAGREAEGWWSVPLTIFWLTACMNAFNLIDGVDGLAAGMGLCATFTILIAGSAQGNVQLAMATAPLAGCLLGFLRYNFAPASIFLGDSGSLLIGFLLGCFGVVWMEKSATVLGLAAPLIALSIPLLDTAMAIARRFLQGQPIFRADRGHVHHRLLDLGLSPRSVALVLYGTGCAAAVLSLLVSWRMLEVPAVGLFCVSALLGIRQLKYPEFALVRGRKRGRVEDEDLVSGKFDEA